MESSKMKNMVVLKNLPSNLIEEAIIVLKENKRAKHYQLIEKKQERKLKSKISNIPNEDIEETTSKQLEKMTKEQDYILKEAEMIVNNYILELETKSTKWKNNVKKLESKYKKSVKLNFILAFATAISMILSVI